MLVCRCNIIGDDPLVVLICLSFPRHDFASRKNEPPSCSRTWSIRQPQDWTWYHNPSRKPSIVLIFSLMTSTNVKLSRFRSATCISSSSSSSSPSPPPTSLTVICTGGLHIGFYNVLECRRIFVEWFQEGVSPYLGQSADALLQGRTVVKPAEWPERDVFRAEIS